jgi:iron complex outermembrane receptor protein
VKTPAARLILLALSAAPALVPTLVAAQTREPPRGGAAPAAAASAPAQQVEITGTRRSDAEERRQATAAKIVIGREEIERFGDATVGEVLKRLPGVTMPGAPGRGGGPRMRGLGGGYTQLLIDGQRVPPGFSLESLTPEQIERIEILRAPTAETGARAIGGTINIVTREGFRRRINDLRVAVSQEAGLRSEHLGWTRNDGLGELTYTVSASAFNGRRRSADTTFTTETELGSGSLLRAQEEHSEDEGRRQGLNLSSRLQWRYGESGSLTLMPVLFHSRREGRERLVLQQTLGPTPAPYDHAEVGSDGRYTLARLNLQWKQTLYEGWRVEVNGGTHAARGHAQSLRREFDGAHALRRTVSDESRSHDRSALLNAKLSRLLAGEHSLVTGFEFEQLRRSETRTTEQDHSDPLAEFDGDLQARSERQALYAQDEWAIDPNWAAHAGLRWEGIRTRGDAADGARTPSNRSQVLTPLLHAVWKPDPQSRDQVRISLTRSYKAPTLSGLVARPRLSSRWPAGGSNTATQPDRAGNPDLRPELATGIDLAFERYLPQGGVLSANLFVRRLRDTIRSTTTLENVAWSPVPRWVSRPRNVGRASTQGLELEARFRLDQMIGGAPPVELRHNLSLFRSRVHDIPGPDNRLDEQPTAVLNLGADYRLRGTPLTLGGSLNLTPGYRTQVSDLQSREAGRKRQFDVYALWVFDPALKLRLLANNAVPDAYRTQATVEQGLLRTQATTLAATEVTWALRLELKL